MSPNSSSSLDYSSAPLPSIPLTPSTPNSSSFFDTTELFDAFPSAPQNLPTGPGTSLLSGFELNSDLGLGGGLGKRQRSPQVIGLQPNLIGNGHPPYLQSAMAAKRVQGVGVRGYPITTATTFKPTVVERGRTVGRANSQSSIPRGP